MSASDVLGNMLAGEAVSENDVSRYSMQITQEEIEHANYQTEALYLDRIRKGDVEGISKDSAPDFGENAVGQLANKPLKQFEYMVCVSIALATRAAIDGGVSRHMACAVSDLYLQRLEQCKSVDEMVVIQMEMKLAFARKVKKARDTRSKTSHVEKCKIFIANHLNRHFELDELADELGVNKSYISRKFKSETGIGIMQYARFQRVEAAANMLKYSDEPISAIASYLCFPSQSHFGAVFKEIKGITPQKYRDMERIT